MKGTGQAEPVCERKMGEPGWKKKAKEGPEA